ncbi:SNF2-related protein [Intrasporangium calvum DSM 43043]|uniref:SNF2-related protein n=1 Tax=Intrasporangium calvum (strain ATCC 23552 / DSM 43043 / JCM 3097 / NBRC 12989 / NCIMB 10167 / NRRL B-3866 / 7 KIP) TaxID=710696 RepID=E6SF94_INTC7|nr:SNF2-related protein [Intrasporangium calvum DSM 43043]
MLVLHGFWSPDRGLRLWAEDSERTVTSPSQAVRSARPHPFAASEDTLAGLGTGTLGEAVLQLPSLARSPLDSPELVRATPRSAARSRPALLPWRVATLDVPPADALAWLLAVADGVDGVDVRGGNDSDVRHGASVGYWADVASWAGELVDRRRVLPAVATDAGRPVALWRPALQGQDVVAFGALVAAMPPVCRAEPVHSDAHELVVTAVQTFTDVGMRRSMGPGLDLVPPRRGRRPRQTPTAEAWLAALTAPNGHFEADPTEVDRLGLELASWAEVATGRMGPARATFRLSEIEPVAGDDGTAVAAAEEDSSDGTAVSPASTRWRLEFLLQSTTDPSLIVPAAQAWADDGSLRRWLDRPQEMLLGELGRASRVYPALSAGLRQARPESVELDADGTYRFLSEAAPALDEAGFGLLLPAWWDRRSRLGLKATASTRRDAAVTGGSFGRDALVDFQWRLAVGDESLTDDEIAALSEAKAPLVRLRGKWVAVDAEQLRRGLEFLRREPAPVRTVAEVLALAAAHPADVDTPLPVTGVAADGWLGDLLGGSVGGGSGDSVTRVEPPATFTATLRPYQARGLAWLSFLSTLGLGSCLADDMGLGKTVQLLALEATQRAADPQAGPSLLLCPMSLVGNWEREAARFAPALRVYAHHGRERLRGAELSQRLATTDLMLTTYATATRDIDDLAGHDWHRVVLDEAQAIKNSLSRTARAARRLRAGHRVALTGTPVENRLSELWSIMDFVNPGMLGTSQSFRTRYAIPVERHGATEPAERLRTITRPYILRRLKSDPTIIDDLPEKLELKEYCRLTVEQASLYQTIVDDMMARIEGSEGIERRGNVLAAMAKLKQVCNHPAQVLHDRSAIGSRSGKVIRLEELLEEILAEGDRVLCFTQYTEFAEMLVPHLSARFDTDVAYLHGGTPKKRRDELVTQFQGDGGAPIFLLSLKAGGTGLNLTAANHVIHLDRWWNPAVENQATDRAYRIGQQRRVQVRKFVCTGTLEEKIDQMIEEKLALANLVVGDGERWLTELSTDQLRSLFALSEEAVGE